LGKTIAEKIHEYTADKMVDAKSMTIGKYSKKRSWPVPFGMDKKEKGYQIAFSDGFVTWIDEAHFLNVYAEEGKNYE
jgi:hypothetical protein